MNNSGLLNCAEEIGGTTCLEGVSFGLASSFAADAHDKQRLNTSEHGCCLCQACGSEIRDRFLLKVLDCFWHERCLSCASCDKHLTEFNTCFLKDGRIYCKEDHSHPGGKRRAAFCKCARMDFVLRCYQKTFHAQCFQCSYCTQSLKKGDQYVFVEGQIMCRRDYNHIFVNNQHRYTAGQANGTHLPYTPIPPTGQIPSMYELDRRLHHSMLQSTHSHHHHGSTKKIPKRPRTILNAQQRKAFKYAFDRGPKPSRKVREQLAKDTGLSVRVVQVWFQNQRAKMKKENRKQDTDKHSCAGSAGSMTISTDSEGKSAADELKSPLGSVKSETSDSELEEFDLEDEVGSDRSSAITDTDISRLSASANATCSLSICGTAADSAQSESLPIAENFVTERDNLSLNPIDNLYRMHHAYFFDS